MFKLPGYSFLKLKRVKPSDDAQIQTQRGQSYVELALVLPILLLILLGLVEISIFIGRYLDVIDLTREASRWASLRDPQSDTSQPEQCIGNLVFFYQTACIFSPPVNACVTGNPFCGGQNNSVPLDLTTDDVLISVFTINLSNGVTNVWPSANMKDATGVVLPKYYQGTSYVDDGGKTGYYWALSDNLPAWTGHPEFPSRDYALPLHSNWKKDCKGNSVRLMPYYTPTRVQAITSTTSFTNTQGAGISSPGNKGYVAVELYYCYKQALDIPLYTFFIPNPVMIHAYTIMPLPAAAPTATPIP